jgi:parallel beta-helix repeat protein
MMHNRHRRYKMETTMQYPRFFSGAVLALLLAGFTPAANAQGDRLTWKLDQRYSVTQAGLAAAVDEARSHFEQNPADTVVIKIPAGRHQLKQTGEGQGSIVLSNLRPGPEGRLIFKGAGRERTTLVFNDSKHAIFGREVYRVTFKDMHMTRPNYTVSQGHVVKVDGDSLILKIQKGFPTPQAINNPDNKRRYVRRYTNSRTDPHIIQKNNKQIPWDQPEHISGRRWRLHLTWRAEHANQYYEPGDLVGIKSKHGGQTYWLYGGSDIRFEGVKWTHKTRGVFRGGIDKVQIVDCVAIRAAPIHGQTPALASPAGGPQIGQPNDPPTRNNLVANNTFVALGDDPIGFFNASGVIRNNFMRDSFARGILLYKSNDTILKNNKLVRNEVLRE